MGLRPPLVGWLVGVDLVGLVGWLVGWLVGLGWFGYALANSF